MTPESIIASARACIGTPFHHQGRAPGVGLDCAGLAIQVCIANGFPFFDVETYGTRPRGGALEAALDGQPCLTRIENSDFAPGDLLLMRFTRDPQHLAIVSGIGIIHAYESAGAVVEHRLDDDWARRIVRSYRFVREE